MSQENVEIIQRLYAAFSRGDFDEAVQHLHKNAELFPAIVGPDYPSHYRGHEGAKELFEVITEVWETVTVEFKDAIEAPDGRIVAVEHWHTVGRDGIELDFELTEVYSFRDGSIARLDGFTDNAQAFEAAGLSE